MAWEYLNKDYKKQAETDPIWHLERLILYGTGKLDRNLVNHYLRYTTIPEERRVFLELLLWEKPF